jgi:hypothetical protein
MGIVRQENVFLTEHSRIFIRSSLNAPRDRRSNYEIKFKIKF